MARVSAVRSSGSGGSFAEKRRKIMDSMGDIGGGSHMGVRAPARGFASLPKPKAPAPVRVSRPRPAPAPKPPPVVVANNKGNFTRPKAPPPVAPGAIKGAGGGARGNMPPSKPVVAPAPPVVATPTSLPVAPAPTESAVPELDQYLGTDTDYQGQLGQFGSALTGFQSEQLGRRNSNAASFAQRLRDLQAAQAADEADLQEDFGARGLSNSGVYAGALSDLQKQYLGSQTALQSEQTTAEQEMAAQLAEFQAQQQAAIQQAREQAIARRAAQYGL